ncbi:MAG: hypothetical protein FJ125_06000 [Deltaproteobacteria bacterium]|nr:hypothetical protein [Deltaproteobacteria bacterium]
MVVDTLGGDASTGFDLNGDGEVDNRFGNLFGIAGDMLQRSLEQGDVIMLLELARRYDWRDAEGVVVNAYYGQVAGGAAFDPWRDLGGQGVFDVLAGSFDEEGDPLVSFSGGRIVDGWLQTGPTTLLLAIPLTGLDQPLLLPVERARISGGLVGEGRELLEIHTGILGGAVRKTELDAAVATAREQPGLDPMLGSMLSQFGIFLGQPDVDLDREVAGNDAYSIGLGFSAVHAQLGDIVW